jgi:hypothetical protein
MDDLLTRITIRAGQCHGNPAFAACASATFTANQIEFLDMVIDHLTDRGVMDARLLYESPFTDLSPLGVEGVFDTRKTARVIHILEGIHRRAAA